MTLVQYSLLAVAGVLLAAAVLARLSTTLGRASIGLSIRTFDRFESTPDRRLARQRSLRAAHIPTNYRQYAAMTRLKSFVGGTVGGVLGIYLMWGVFNLLATPKGVGRRVLPDSLSFLVGLLGFEKPVGLELFAFQVGVALLCGLGTALSIYYLRWYYPRYVADERARQIEMSLPMTVSFFYALSRSGMPFPKMMRILAANDHVYGNAAEEVDVAVRNVDLFGMDVISAVKTMARRSPSSQFQEFSENLASVLQTGGSLSDFLHREYQDFRQEAESQQERLLELVETLAEAYVTLAVAGSLFLIVILTITNIATGGSLTTIQVIVYAVIPLGNLAFIVYLSTVVDNLSPRDPTDEEISVDIGPRGIRRTEDLPDEGAARSGTDSAAVLARADGGGASDASGVGPDDSRADPDATGAAGGSDDDGRIQGNLERLAVYKQWREVRDRLKSPLRTVVRRPTALLWVTFPVAVFLVGIRIPGLLSDGTITVAEFDDLVIQSVIFLFGTLAVAYEVYRRRVEAIESSIPDFLDRMASLNEAGMTVVDSLDRIRDTELGTLDEELELVWRDIQWGADIETALKRFESRVRTETVSRVVTLTTEAMKASGNLGVVLRIAANQAKSDRRLKNKRRQEMFTYLVVVYVAFFVFLFIVAVLNNVLLNNLPDTSAVANFTSGGAGGTGGQLGGIAGLGNIDREAYGLTFLHATMIQGFFSGIIAGQLSTGDIRAGAKHATILVTIGYLAFVLGL